MSGPEIFTFEQGSEEWRKARLGIPTASEFASILAKGEGKVRRTYMMKLIGEVLTGEPAERYSNAHMERGHEMEADARNLYAFRLDVDPLQVGFIRNGDQGCSPDSLVGDEGMCEIKTKLPHIQAEVLLSGRVPPEHMAQLQGNLWVADRGWIDFVSYWPRMPLFVKRVYRDEAYIERLEKEVGLFVREMRTLLAVLQGEELKVA
jgi:hypothetical protein